MDLEQLRYRPGTRLKDYDPADTSGCRGKEEALIRLEENKARMATLQDILYAQGKYALLAIFQGMDTSGKDSAIKHVMTGLNPQGVQAVSFKAPNAGELAHDYMWRTDRQLPPKGTIGVFNRSYYEDVLVVRVHGMVPGHGPEDKDFWEMRYRQIRDKERYLLENHIVPVKLFLHISKQEQAKRLLKRIDNPEKNWKFDASDIRERAYWKDYIAAYEAVFDKTSTDKAPWYIVPANKKWYARLVISEIMLHELGRLKLSYPQISEEQHQTLEKYRAMLEQEV